MNTGGGVMSYTEEMIRKLDTEKVREQLRYLYGEDEMLLKTQQNRYARLIRRYAELFAVQSKYYQKGGEENVL